MLRRFSLTKKAPDSTMTTKHGKQEKAKPYDLSVAGKRRMTDGA